MHYNYFVAPNGDIYSHSGDYILGLPPLNKKENTMYTTQDALRLQIKRTQEQLTKMQAELEKLDNPYGDDNWPIGTVMRFSLRHDPFALSRERGTFAVIKGNSGRWYPTGPEGWNGRTWEQLVEIWEKYNVKPYEIQVLATHETLGEEPF